MKQFLLLACVVISSLCTMAKNGAEIIRENGFQIEVAPMLTTQWSQDGGENSMLPMVGDRQAKTGCGATATAQVMKFWSFPKRGYGENYYIWDNPKGGREVLYADFSSARYDWDNMIPLYKNNVNASAMEIKAVSKLMSDLGIALEMKYQESSTATNMEYISTVLKKYFGYNPTMTIHRYANGAYTMDEWLTMIYRELSQGRPIIMGGAYKGANHIYVADGYDSDGKIHLNLGKASIGSSCNIDGYYDLTITGQTYNENMRMLIGISPVEIPYDIADFNIATPGTLKETLGGELYSRKLCRLRLTGHLNANDIAWLKTLSASTTGQLSYIDMKGASIENNSLPESAFDNCYTLQEIILPDNLSMIETKAFRNCTGLWKVSIPASLKTIGNYAFSNCRYLEDMILPADINTIAINPFRYDKISDFSISTDNELFNIRNGALLSSSDTKLISMPRLTIGTYYIEDGIKSVEDQAFLKQCMIQTLHIPASIQQIKSNAFLECIGLKDIYVASTTPPDIRTNSFDANILDKCIIHVPSGTKNAYDASNWNIFSNIMDDNPYAETPNIIEDTNTSYQLYDLHGNKLETPFQGCPYIIRYSNGTTEKRILAR